MCAKKKIHANFTLSETDIKAILCALPLVIEIGAATPLQQEINTALCESAAQKLAAHSNSLTANEIRVVSAAVTAALLFLSGQAPATFTGVDQEHKQDLSKYFFTYNRLDPIFQAFCEQFQS